MMTCLVIDDEPYAASLLESYILQVPFLQLVHKCHHGLEALEYLKTARADLVFLDINMPQLSGMQLATLLRPDQPLIFTTAYSEYAVESYERRALDYLLKPITFERFLKAVAKAEDLMQKKPQKEDRNTLFVKTGRAFVPVQYDSIYFVEGLKDYVIFHTAEGKHVVYKRMKEVEESFPAQFSRIHLSYIVNRKHIRRVEDHHVQVQQERLPISEKYRDSFYQAIQRQML